MAKSKKIVKKPAKPTKKTKAKKRPEKKKPIADEINEPLSDKEEQLCREFICDYAGNQVRSYMHVYGTVNYDSARTESSKVFANPNIKKRIAELQEERNKRLEITADRVLAEIAKLAFYDPRSFFDSDGRLKPIDELDPDQAAIIGGIETFHKVDGDEKDGMAVITKIKMADKGANLERLGRSLKLFTDKTEHTGPGGGPLKVVDVTDEELLAIIKAGSGAGTSKKKKGA
jgi:phage terminase small subunit